MFNSNPEKTIAKYEEGQSKPAAIIGFSSGLVFTVLFFVAAQHRINWTNENLMSLLVFYLLVSLMGWLSLVKFRYYEIEKEDQNDSVP